MTKVIAFDIGGTNSRITLFEHGKIVWRDEAATPGAQGPEAVMDTMMALHSKVSALNVPVGVAITGHIVDGHVTAHNPVILPGWQGYPLETALAARLNVPVCVVNDARAAAWGEYVFGAGRGHDEFLFITVSTGVGAGLILNRRLHIARNGFDAEMGLMMTEDGENLEHHASGTAVGRLAIEHGYASGKSLCDAADAGDPVAEKLLRHGIREIAKKCADMAVMLGILRVAIGGGLGLRPGYLARLREELARFPGLYHVELVPAELGHDAGLYGAAAMATTCSVKN